MGAAQGLGQCDYIPDEGICSYRDRSPGKDPIDINRGDEFAFWKGQRVSANEKMYANKRKNVKYIFEGE